MEPTRINCYHCQHFYITWEKSFPNGCKAYGFKSQRLPSALVFESSQQPCSYFQPKTRPNLIGRPDSPQ